MGQKWLYLFTALSLCVAPTHALVDFYGYSTYRSEEDSLDRYHLEELGCSELEISEITVIPRGAYLDVAEDAWISSDVARFNIEGLTEDYLFKGTIPVPREAAITGVQTWRGERMYRAMLRQARYSSDVHFEDSVSLQQSLDSRVALLQQHSETVFEITLARVALGERTHVRIRYLLKPSAAQAGQFTIPVLFHTIYGRHPQYIRFTIEADDNRQMFTLSGSDGSMYLLDDTGTTMVPYAQALALKHEIAASSYMNITEFTAGNYSGNYCMVNADVSGSVISALTRPVSTVFIWRWNGTPNMISVSNQVKTLSNEALTIVEQAERMKSAVIELHNKGNRCALIHSVEGANTRPFATEEMDSGACADVISYLEGVNGASLYEKYRNASSTGEPGWVVSEDDKTNIQRARDDFLAAISSAQELLRGGQGYKHIVLVTAGGVSKLNPEDLHESVSLSEEGITIAYQSAIWRGVNMEATLNVDCLSIWNGFYFPPFTPVTIGLTLNNNEQPFIFPLKKESWDIPVTFTGRTAAAWDTVLTWTGFDSDGKPFRSVTENPALYRHRLDSSLAKLWAADGDHMTDREENFPGGTFGILTKSTYLQATVDNVAEDVSETVPFLSDEEIYAYKSLPARNRARSESNCAHPRLINGNLHIPASGGYTELRVFDLQGRLLLRLDLRVLGNCAQERIVSLEKLLGRRRLHLLVLRLSGSKGHETFHLMNGRVR